MTKLKNLTVTSILISSIISPFKVVANTELEVNPIIEFNTVIDNGDKFNELISNHIEQERQSQLEKRVEVIREERLKREEAERIERERILAEKKKQLELQQAKSNYGTYYMKVSHYSPYCNTGCTGVTATGIDVRNTVYYQGMRIIAADTNIIPLWSIVQLDLPGGSVKAIVLDRGGAIKGNKLDFLVSSEAEAYRLGVYKNVKLTVLRKGRGE